VEHIQHCRQSLCRSLLLLQCGASSCALGLCNSSFMLRFWLINEAQRHFHFALGRLRTSLCSSHGSSRELGSTWGAVSSSNTRQLWGTSAFLLQCQQLSSVTSQVLKDHAQGDVAGTCLPGAISAPFTWRPLPIRKSFPRKLGKRRAPREVFKRNSFHLRWWISC